MKMIMKISNTQRSTNACSIKVEEIRRINDEKREIAEREKYNEEKNALDLTIFQKKSGNISFKLLIMCPFSRFKSSSRTEWNIECTLLPTICWHGLPYSANFSKIRQCFSNKFYFIKVNKCCIILHARLVNLSLKILRTSNILKFYFTRHLHSKLYHADKRKRWEFLKLFNFINTFFWTGAK